MSDQEKHRWVDNALQVMERAAKAEPGAGVLNRIQQRLNQPVLKKLPARVVWAGAASLALLVSLNITMLATSDRNYKKTDAVDMIVKEYQLANDEMIGYE